MASHLDFMIWIAPSEKDADNAALENRLSDAADTATRNMLLKRLLSGQVELATN